MELLATPNTGAFIEAELSDINADTRNNEVDSSVWDDPVATFGPAPTNASNLAGIHGAYEQAPSLQGLDSVWASLGINPTPPNDSGAGLDLEGMFTHPSVPEIDALSMPNSGPLAMLVDTPAISTTIEEVLSLCLALGASLEPSSFTTDMLTDQPNSSSAGPAFDTTSGTPEGMLMTTEPAQVDWPFNVPEQNSLAAYAYAPSALPTSGPPPLSGVTPVDSEIPMTDELCLAQLEELCHGVTVPASLDANFDLSATLDCLLSGLSSLPPAPLESQSKAPSAPLVLAAPDGPSSYLRLQGWVDSSIIFDAIGMDKSEGGSDTDSEPPVTPHSAPMDIDQTREIQIQGYQAMDECEQKTVCPLDMLMASPQMHCAVSRF